MKALHKIISSVKPHFEEGGKLAKFWVVFDSLETFTFTPGHVTNNGIITVIGLLRKRLDGLHLKNTTGGMASQTLQYAAAHLSKSLYL